MQIDGSKILEGLGVKTESFDRLKLGHGVVGNPSLPPPQRVL